MCVNLIGVSAFWVHWYVGTLVYDIGMVHWYGGYVHMAYGIYIGVRVHWYIILVICYIYWYGGYVSIGILYVYILV